MSLFGEPPKVEDITYEAAVAYLEKVRSGQMPYLPHNLLAPFIARAEEVIANHVDDPVQERPTIRGALVNAAALALHDAKENGHPLWDDLWPNVSTAEICLEAFFDELKRLDDHTEVLDIAVWRLIQDIRAGF